MHTRRRAACTAFVLLAGTLLGSVLQRPQQVTILHSDTFHAGTTSSGTLLTHQFILDNPGSTVCEIEPLPPDCGCDMAPVLRLQSTTIAPYGTVGVTLQVTAHGTGERKESVKLIIRQNNHLRPLWLFVQYTAVPPPTAKANH